MKTMRLAAAMLVIGMLAGCAHRPAYVELVARCVGGFHCNEPAPTAADLRRNALLHVDLVTGRVRFIQIDTFGCYGRCPHYQATFGRDGRARFESTMCRAEARVPFVRALQAASEAVGMKPTYPSSSIDSFGAQVLIVTFDGTFSSSGRDRGTWGPEFLITEARLDQLVHDSTWTPSLTTGACARALGGIRALE